MQIPSTRPAGLHLSYLDSLRGIAILMVLLVHSAEAAYVSTLTTTWKLAFMGQRGVELFYMVSAFTLFLSLDRPSSERRPLRNFFVRRFFRIAPAFYFAVILELFLYGFWHPQRYRYILAFLFLNGWDMKAISLNIVGCWSIAVEATFYLFVPFLHARIKTLKAALLWFISAAGIFLPLSYWLALRLPSGLREYFEVLWFPVQVPVFLLGIVTYMIWKDLRLAHVAGPGGWTTSIRRTYACMLLAGAALLLLSNVEWRDRELFTNMRLLPCAVGLLLLILSGAIWPWPLLFNRFTAFMGKISYSIYLGHFFFVWTYLTFFPRPARPWLSGPIATLVEFLLLTTVMVPVGWIMWRYLEQPGVALGRTVIQRLEHRAGPPAETIADHAAI